MEQRGGINLEYSLGVCCLAGVVLAGLLAWQSPSSATLPTELPAAASPRLESATVAGAPHYVGLAQAGCALSNCHGHPAGSDPSWHNAGLLFSSHDAHARAYEILFDARSRQIIHRLQPTTLENSEEYFNVISQRCITCHATPLPAEIQPTSPAGVELLAQGVACESCHGPASHWLSQHTTVQWETTAVATKQQLGFIPLEDANALSQTCVQCHIGSPGSKGSPAREVTHDLIAAGHPRLDFELAVWRMALPKHWNSSHLETNPGEWVKVWQLGQYSAFAAQQKLAADQQQRSTQEMNPAPWPEFSHVECASCHRSLQFAKSRSADMNSPWHVVELSWLAATIHPASFAQSLRTSLTTGEPVALPAATQPEPLSVEQLRTALLLQAEEINTWDRLLAWCHAADVMRVEAERSAQNNSAAANKLELYSLQLDGLRDAVNSLASSRYASPHYPNAVKNNAPIDQRSAIEASILNVKQSLRELDLSSVEATPLPPAAVPSQP